MAVLLSEWRAARFLYHRGITSVKNLQSLKDGQQWQDFLLAAIKSRPTFWESLTAYSRSKFAGRLPRSVLWIKLRPVVLKNRMHEYLATVPHIYPVDSSSDEVSEESDRDASTAI